jgi:hypothetical protein
MPVPATKQLIHPIFQNRRHFPPSEEMNPHLNKDTAKVAKTSFRQGYQQLI